MSNRRNIDALVCDLLGGCSIEGSALVSAVQVGDAVHLQSPTADRIVTLADDVLGTSRWIAEDVRRSGARMLCIFQDDYRPCGEIHTNDGSFTRAVFSGCGEDAIGERMREWQVRGVPRVLMAEDASALIETRVPFRSPSFHAVANAWLGSQGYLVVDAPSVLLGVWQRVIHQADSDKDRYTMMQKAASSSLLELADLCRSK